MKKPLKYLIGIISSFFVLFVLYIFIYDRSIPQPALGHLDAVMVDNEIYFVLEDEYNLRGISVRGSSVDFNDVMWACQPARENDYIKTGQLKYGQKIEAYKLTAGPKELQKNISYAAVIGTSRRTLYVAFTISGDNKITMTHRFDLKRPRNRTVIVEKNGQKITIPYSVSFDKNGNKVTVSEPSIN